MAPPWEVIEGDALAVLRTLPAGAFQTCVSSPPYWALRSYLKNGDPLKALEMGLEQSPDCFGWATGTRCGACYVCRMTAVFREVRRTLRDDGTLWVNVAGSYAGGAGRSPPQKGLAASQEAYDGRPRDPANNSRMNGSVEMKGGGGPPAGWKQKDYVNVPALLAESLRADGWYLRAEIALTKVAPMPESCRDRPTRATEKLYLFSVRPRYYYDREAELIEHVELRAFAGKEAKVIFCNDTNTQRYARGGMGKRCSGVGQPPGGRNLWDYWDDTDDDLPPAVWQWRPEAKKGGGHYATFPLWLPLRCVKLGTSARGCCGRCGAPWRRVVERKGGTTGKGWNDHEHDQTHGLRFEGSQGNSSASARAWQNGDYQRSTLGWQPSCRCYGVDLLPPPPRPDADPQDVAAWLALRDRLLPLYEPLRAVPARVLDCFAGTGTVGVAARLLGRTFTGIDLSPGYVAVARERLAACCPLDDAILSAAPRAVPPQRSLFPEEEPP